MKDASELSALGQHLRKYRRANRWSLAAFAAEYGFSKSFMWELENGAKNNPSLNTMMKLARATDTTLARIATLAAIGFNAARAAEGE